MRARNSPPKKSDEKKSTSSLEKSFGSFVVIEAERRSRIRAVFEGVAPRYDLLNDLMSFGIHRWWKRRLQKFCSSWSGHAIDLAGGTGDVARLLVGDGRTVTVCDPSLQMMEEGRKKMARSSIQINWLAGEAESLPFATNSVDLITVSFGLRNTTKLSTALAEIHRVLKPSGQFVCLEFSRPKWWLAPFYDLYSWLVIPRLGALIARQPSAYQYLVESIRRFPDQKSFAELIELTGFSDVGWNDFSFGIACLHFGKKQ